MDINCPVCFQEYNLSTRLPRITLVCGHSFCSSCLSHIIQSIFPRCPLDKSPLPAGSDVEKFPINFALKEVLEARPQADCCPDHGDELISFCLTDKRRICLVCLEEDHRGHQIRGFKSIKGQTANYRKQMADLRQNMKETRETVDGILDNDADVLIEKIEEDYNALVQVLMQKKQYLKAQTKLIFSQEKNRIKGLLGADSALSLDISQKDLGLQNILKQEEVAQLEEAPHVIESFQNQYQAIISSGLQPEKIGEYCSKAIESFGLQPDLILYQEAKLKPEHLLTFLTVSTNFSFEFNFESLIMRNNNENPQEIQLDMQQIPQVKNLTLVISQSVSFEDIELLNFIWGSLTDIIGLKLKFATDTVTKALSQIFSSNCHRLQSIEIDITGYAIDTKKSTIKLVDPKSHMVSLFRDIFRAAKNVQVIKLEMANIVAAEGVLEKMFKGGIFETRDLQEFHLILDEAKIEDKALQHNFKIEDKDIQHIFMPMPKLQSLYLSLQGTKITDKTLICMAQSTLASAQFLRTFSLTLTDTNVTDIGTEFLCQNLNSKEITALMLNFRATHITDKSAEMLSQRMLDLDLFENLEVLFLVFSRTKISDDGIIQLLKPVPNVKDFYLMLNETKITDKSIDHLIETCLSSQENPEMYMLYLGNTQVTDNCFNNLLRSIKDAKRYYLAFENTAISDATIEDFIDEKLSTESICQALDIATQGSHISERLQSKIKQISDQILQKSEKTNNLSHLSRGFTRLDSFSFLNV